MTKDRLDRTIIAMRVAKELPDGSYVNLGIGIPTLVSLYIPDDRTVLYHSESGVLGYTGFAEEGKEDVDLVNAGGHFLAREPGMAFFHSAESFSMIRGGHIDVAVMGALQVSKRGDLSNWILPDRGIGNIGGAMDLAAGVKTIIIAMEHTDKMGRPKIVENCTYPVTARSCVNLIVTDVGVFVISSKGLVLTEVAPGWTADDIQAITEPDLIVSKELKEIAL